MRAKRSNAGFTLIEVLIALVVMSIGLLGLAALQIQGMKYNSDAYFRTQATTLAYDIIDRMRANATAARSGLYAATTAPAGSSDCEAAACSAPDLAQYDLKRWYDALAVRLPKPLDQPSSIQSAGGQHTITIRWAERDLIMSQSWVVAI